MQLNIQKGQNITLLDTANIANYQGDWVNRAGFLRNSLQVVNQDNSIPVTVTIYASLDAVSWQPIATTTKDDFIILPAGIYPYIRAERDQTVAKTVTVKLVSGQFIQ